MQCLRFVALNVNNFAARWETIMNSRADVMTLTETRVNALRLNSVAQGGGYINLIDFLNPLPRGSKTEAAKGVLEKKGCFWRFHGVLCPVP